MLKKFMEINMITHKLIILIVIQKLRSSVVDVLISLFNGQVVILNLWEWVVECVKIKQKI